MSGWSRCAARPPNAYLRMIENRFVSSEETFVDMAWWDACTTGRRSWRTRRCQCGLALTRRVKRDSTGIAACTWDSETQKVRLVTHRIFQPSPDEPLDFERTVEDTLLSFRQRFSLRAVCYDPYQMAAVAQRLLHQGVPMVEFPQSVGNLTAASQNLYELIKGQGLAVYPDDDIRLAVQRSVAIETTRGWRIAKDKQSHKIDIVVALAQAAYAAVQQQGEQTFMRMGGIGVDGTIFWHDAEPERPRIRYVTITEREDLKQRGLL